MNVGRHPGVTRGGRLCVRPLSSAGWVANYLYTASGGPDHLARGVSPALRGPTRDGDSIHESLSCIEKTVENTYRQFSSCSVAAREALIGGGPVPLCDNPSSQSSRSRQK